MNDLKVINFTHAYTINHGEQDLKAALGVFETTMKKMKEKPNPKASDFTQVARIESMIYLYVDQIPATIDKTNKEKQTEDIAMNQILNIKVPHVQFVKELLQVHKQWEVTQFTIAKGENLVGDEECATDEEADLEIQLFSNYLKNPKDVCPFFFFGYSLNHFNQEVKFFGKPLDFANFKQLSFVEEIVRNFWKKNQYSTFVLKVSFSQKSMDLSSLLLKNFIYFLNFYLCNKNS